MHDANCAMCGRTDRPLTREHVFARWLVLKLRAARLVPLGATAENERISRVLATVCADCNAGWMSGLEVSLRRAAFARPRVGEIPAPDRTTLSRWFTKTAALLAHARGRAFLTTDERARIVTAMPDGIEVFIARRRRPPQRLDVSASEHEGVVRWIAIQLDDLVGHVARRDVLSSAHGTRLWPLRSHTLRWDTLPVLTATAHRADPLRPAQ